MNFRPLVSAAILSLLTSSPAAAVEYNFSFDSDVTRDDCYAMEVRIDKYLALADEALAVADVPSGDLFIKGQAFLSVAADFTRVFAKFCEDA